MITPKRKTVGIYEAKTHLLALLKQVECGKEIVITRRKRPVARLVPIDPATIDKDIFAKIRAFHGKISLPKGETCKNLIRAGRRM
jgi:prevent-host-death family protein